MTDSSMIREPTDNHLVFELISGYIHSIDDAMTFAQLNRGAFDAVYFNKRVRNRVLQEFLTVIVKGIMRNEYDYKALMAVKNKLVLGMSPVTRRCPYRNRNGPGSDGRAGRAVGRPGCPNARGTGGTGGPMQGLLQ